MSVTISLEVSATKTAQGTTWAVHPWLEGMELEENIMGEDRPIYTRTSSGDLVEDGKALIECLEDAYRNERDYVESIGETLMTVETERTAGNGSLTMYTMTGAGTPCAITKEWADFKAKASLC